MEERDLTEQNDADRNGSPERPNATGENYDPQVPAEDVLQDEDYTGPAVTVPVCIEGPVRAKTLPTHMRGLRSVAVADRSAAGSRAVRILDGDPRRSRAVLQIPTSESLRLGTTRADAEGEYAFVLIGNATTAEKLEIHSCDEVWGIGVDGAFNVSVLNEQWTG